MGRLENPIDNAIEQYLNWNNIKNWRSQVLHGWFRHSKKKKEYWIYQGTPGLGDRQAILPDGKTLYIEGKKKDGKQSDSQIKFEAYCKANNCPYVLAESAKDVSDYLRRYFKGTEFEKRIVYL